MVFLGGGAWIVKVLVGKKKNRSQQPTPPERQMFPLSFGRSYREAAFSPLELLVLV